jgi:hypothetical protein
MALSYESLAVSVWIARLHRTFGQPQVNDIETVEIWQ